MKIVMRRETLINKAEENVKIYAEQKFKVDSEDCADFLAALRLARNEEVEITFEEYRRYVKPGGIIKGYRGSEGS